MPRHFPADKKRVGKWASFAVVPTSAAPANPDKVIYLGKDTAIGGDGTSASSPLGTGSTGTYKDAPLYQAWDEIITGGYTNAVIVFTDVYTIQEADAFRTLGDKDVGYTANTTNLVHQYKNVSITYTSVYGGIDYRSTKGAMLAFEGIAGAIFPTTTVTEDLTVLGSQNFGTRLSTWISAGFSPLTLGNGTNFLPGKNASGTSVYPYVCGGYRNGSTFGVGTVAGRQDTSSTNITVDVGEGNNVGLISGCMGYASHAVAANVNITIKSGTINGQVFGDSQGTDSSKLTTGNINITINGGTFKTTVAYVNNGFASGNTKTGTITVTGGTFNASIMNKYSASSSSGVGAATLVIDCMNASQESYQSALTASTKGGVGASVVKPSPFQNITTGIRYDTLAEACAEANSGEVIHMNAAATEGNVVTPKGVTLYLDANTLTADAVIGLAGSGIYGNTASCKIVVPQGNLILDEAIYTDNSGNSFLPYWDAANSCYKLSTVGLNTDGFGMAKTDTEITFKFEHALAQSARNVIGTAAADNGVKVAVQLRWMVGNNEAVQNFYFSDADFATVEGGGNYTFSLTNYAELGIDGATVEIHPMVVTDTGVVFYGETWVNGAIAQ